MPSYSYPLQLLGRVFGVGGGMVSSAFGILTNTMQKGFQNAIQFHKEGIAFARDMAMSAKQAQAYTDVMIARTQVLANRYGVSAEAIMQVQRGLSEATGKQLLLNDAQAEGFVQIDKLMGAQARSRFTEEIMNGMGGQINTVQGAMAKVYATAAKQGLNAKKLSDKVAQNLSMANRLSFRNGIDGITRMAALSEKLGINMQSVESAASSFLELDKAIENSAKMQMLGGSAAAMFGNPLTASYEANYDPEAFAKRMSDSLASYATFDAQKGISNINGMNMDFVRAIGQAMGISAEDAAKMAKKQAEVRFKERAFSPLLNRYGLTEDQRSFLINNGQVRNGELFYTDAKGEEHNVSRGDINQTLLDEIRKFEGMSDKDIMIEQSRTLISIDEHIEGAASTVAASFAEGISKHLPNIGQQIEKIGKHLSSYAQQWGKDTGKAVGKAMAWINDHGPEIKIVADGLLKGLSFLINLVSDYTKTAIALFLGWKLFGIGGLVKGGLKKLIGKLFGGSSGGKGAVPKTASNTATKHKDRSWKQAKSDARLGMGSKKGGIFAKGRSGLGTLWNNSKYFRRAVKGAAGIGTALAVADVGYSIYDAEKKKNEINNNVLLSQKQKIEEKNKVIKEEGQNVGDAIGGLGGGLGGAALGAAIGTAIAPGIGTILGGLLGGVAGGFGGSAVGKSIGGAVSKSFMGTEHHAQGGIVGGKGGVDSTPAMLTPGEIVLSETMQKNLVSMLKNPPIEVKINNEGINARQAYLPQQFEPIQRFAQGGVVGGNNEPSYTPSPIASSSFLVPSQLFEPIQRFAQGGVVGGNNEPSYTPSPIAASSFLVPSQLFEPIQRFAQGGVVSGDNSNYTPPSDTKLLYDFLSRQSTQVQHFAQGGIVKNRGWVDYMQAPRVDSPRISLAQPSVQTEYHAQGGVVGGNGDTDSTPAMLTPGEIVLSETMQKNLVSILKNPPIEVKPVGEKEYIYTPTNVNTSNVGSNTVTVKDFNVNLSGTIKLDGGNSMKNVDVKSLLNDYQFVNSLKQIIKESINADMNGGRFMNDVSTLRGHTTSSSVLGR